MITSLILMGYNAREDRRTENSILNGSLHGASGGVGAMPKIKRTLNMKRPKILLNILMLPLLFMGSEAYSSDQPQSETGDETVIASVQQPNLFVMTGAGVEITYSTSSFGGPPLLTYKDRQRTLTFQGDEIRQLDSEIGQQVTVVIDEIPDLQTVTFTLLLPTINLDEPKSRFRTIGIIATHRTSIGGPDLVKGVLQTYRLKELKGTAQWVNF